MTEVAVNNIAPETIKSVEVFKGEKAISLFGTTGKNGVVKIMLKSNSLQKPGNNKVTSILSYTNTDSQNKQTTVAVNDGSINNAIYYIDGKESSKAIMLKLNEADILRVDVLKGDQAIKAYGDNGKHGVIKITTKQAVPSLSN